MLMRQSHSPKSGNILRCPLVQFYSAVDRLAAVGGGRGCSNHLAVRGGVAVALDLHSGGLACGRRHSVVGWQRWRRWCGAAFLPQLVSVTFFSPPCFGSFLILNVCGCAARATSLVPDSFFGFAPLGSRVRTLSEMDGRVALARWGSQGFAHWCGRVHTGRRSGVPPSLPPSADCERVRYAPDSGPTPNWTKAARQICQQR
jgi:hypothetical protein